MKRLIIVICLLLLPMNIQAKTYTKKECKKYAYTQVIKFGWSVSDYNNLVKLWNKESSWNAKARNKRSGACGIPQAYPCKKMKTEDTFLIEAKAILKNNSKKMLDHVADFRYVSSDENVAAVDENGLVTAKGDGTCVIYVYAQNGYAKKVLVSVE